MTDTFDYSGLASHVRAIALPHHASDLLRTRIEAAFVHRDSLEFSGSLLLCKMRDEIAEATARAEAAEARVAELTAQLAEARESEQAAVVAWLNAHPDAPVGDYARGFAFAIEEGSHLK